ncbi:MAG: hypothetical protein RR501_01145 [Cloacibacillus sp.]
MKVRYTVELQNDAYKIFDNSVEKVKSGFSLNVVPRGAAKSVELIGPKGVVSLADALKTGKAFVIGDKDRATVMIDFYLYNDSGAPSYGNGGKIVLPDGKADNVLDTGALWAGAHITKESSSGGSGGGCEVFDLNLLLGAILMTGLMFRKRGKK